MRRGFQGFPLPLVLALLAPACGASRGTVIDGPASAADGQRGDGGADAARPVADASRDAALSLAARIAGWKVMSYYPAQNSWSNMWSSWVPATIDADFARLHALGANVVRIVIQAKTFGYPVPSPTMQSELAQMVSMASANGLAVQLTLFDWWASYTDLTGSTAWAAAMLGPYAGDGRVAFLELQNEIDPTNTAAMAWAKQLLPALRRDGGGIPVTVSVTGPADNLTALANALAPVRPDFWDWHDYMGAMWAAHDLVHAASLVVPDPLIIGETGQSTSTADRQPVDLPATTAAFEAYQEYFYRSLFFAARNAGLPPPAPWILYDFVPGTLTWTTDPVEYDYGLYHDDGTAKPAASTVMALYRGATIDTSFDGGMEQDASGEPGIWQQYHASEATFARDTTVFHSGAASGRISASTGDSLGWPAFYCAPIAVITAGTSFTATAWVRGQAATGTTRLAIGWFAPGGSYLSSSVSTSLPTGDTPWTQLSVSATAPAGAVMAQLHLQSAYNSGSAWFDDVTFTSP